MMTIIAAGLWLGMIAAGPVATTDHVVRVDHHSGPVNAHYRGQVAVNHQQIGSVAPGGRPSTLRCVWTVDMTVNRRASSASGATMTRSFVREDVLSGSRPGWCSGQRAAIAEEVAARMADMEHMTAMAAEDHEVLRAELDRLHGPVRAG